MKKYVVFASMSAVYPQYTATLYHTMWNYIFISLHNEYNKMKENNTTVTEQFQNQTGKW
jgi:hypothetical protein